MIVRISFEMQIPDVARLETVKKAAHQALVMMENIVERETEPFGAPAGTGRIVIKFNNQKVSHK